MPNVRIVINKPKSSTPIGLVLTSSRQGAPTVTQIDDESPARSVLQVGDRILAINGERASGALRAKSLLWRTRHLDVDIDRPHLDKEPRGAQPSAPPLEPAVFVFDNSLVEAAVDDNAEEDNAEDDNAEDDNAGDDNAEKDSNRKGAEEEMAESAQAAESDATGPTPSLPEPVPDFVSALVPTADAKQTDEDTLPALRFLSCDEYADVSRQVIALSAELELLEKSLMAHFERSGRPRSSFGFDRKTQARQTLATLARRRFVHLRGLKDALHAQLLFTATRRLEESQSAMSRLQAELEQLRADRAAYQLVTSLNSL